MIRDHLENFMHGDTPNACFVGEVSSTEFSDITGSDIEVYEGEIRERVRVTIHSVKGVDSGGGCEEGSRESCRGEVPFTGLLTKVTEDMTNVIEIPRKVVGD